MHTETKDPEELLDVEQLCREVPHLTPAAFYNQRARGDGPPAARIGRRLYVRRRDLNDWFDARKSTGTAA